MALSMFLTQLDSNYDSISGKSVNQGFLSDDELHNYIMYINLYSSNFNKK